MIQESGQIEMSTGAQSQRPSQLRRVRRQRGFTLIELSIVIAVLGILVALLLPAVQQAREAARRTQCKNNLHQLGIAFHSYQDAFDTLPPGVVNLTGPIQHTASGYHYSWVTALLPHLDAPTISQRLDRKVSIYDDRNLVIRQNRLEILTCPSDPNPSFATANNQQVALINYAGNHHPVSAPIDADNHGVLFLNSRVRYKDIFDGMTTTILAGEIFREESDLGWASGTRATLRNSGSLPNANTRGNQFGGNRNSYLGGYGGGGPNSPNQGQAVAAISPLDPGGLDSSHTGGAQYLMCDGSCRFLSENIDLALYQQLFDRADGAMVEEF